MIKLLLKEIQIYENREEYGKKYSEFTFQTQCITTMYENYLQNFYTSDIYKVNICCGQKLNERTIMSHSDGFLTIFVPFDVPLFLTLKDQQKKIQLLECLQQSLLWVANEFDLQDEPCIQAYQQCIEANYECKYFWKKPKYNSARKLKAVVEIEITLYKAALSISVLTNSEELIKHKVLIEEKPNIFLLDRYLGEFKWSSNKEIRLYHKYSGNTTGVDFLYLTI